VITPPSSEESTPLGRIRPEQVPVALPTLKAWVTYSILGLTAALFIGQLILQTTLGEDLLLIYGARMNEYILQGQVWRFFTPALVHISFLQITFNLYALYVIGRGLERFYGHPRFITLYLLSVFAGNVIAFLFAGRPSAGAGPGLMGLLAAQTLFIDQNRFLFGTRSRSLVITALVFVVINVLLGLMPGMDNMGNIGGMVGGTVFAWLAGPRLLIQPAIPAFLVVDQVPARRVLTVACAMAGAISVLAAVGFFSAI
jgi:rhomboid protease GluP